VDFEAVMAMPVKAPSRPSRGSETILLVEDEDLVRSVTSRVLINQGYVVLQASSGQGAIQLLQQFDRKLGLILADVVMPDMSGPELVNRLLPECPGVKVLYMSGYAEGDKGQPRESFEHALLQKPFSAESLVLAVRQVLDRGSASSE
jgi:CheY-like chemotaxis protein